MLLAVLCSWTSAARRLVSPGRTWPPPLFHLGSSCEATVLGLSPALRRESRDDPCIAPQPTLKVQLTMAPYWLAFRVTPELVARVTHCSYR